MKIINRKTFLALPAGIIYSKYYPHVLEELCVKQETIENCDDFLYTNLIHNVKCNSSTDYCDKLKTGEFELDFEVDCRDGCFNDEELFAVYEQRDIDKFIAALKECKGF